MIEKKFANVLLIRRALGSAILAQIKPFQEEKQTQVIETLTAMLEILFPCRQDIGHKMKIFVGQAVEIANTMAEEKILFCGSMIHAGHTFNDGCMESFEDPQNNRVYMCTFPMFAVRVVEDDEEAMEYLVKANVAHEGLFANIVGFDAVEGKDNHLLQGDADMSL